MATPNQLPAKSPILDKYKSRLHITYRTNISGTPVPQKLPFRVLVMGELLGTDQRKVQGTDLRHRPIRSIQMGAADSSVAAFMKEITPWMRVPKALRKALEARVPGTVTLDDLSFPAPSFDARGLATVTVTGTATFKSSLDQNGVCELSADNLVVTGTITVSQATGKPLTLGTPSMILKVTGVVQGDILDHAGKPTGVLTALFDPEEPRASFTVDPSKCPIKLECNDDATKFIISVTSLPPNPPPKIPVAPIPPTFPVIAVRTLPFQSLNAFSPDEVVRSIPELQRLSVMRGLLHEFQSTLRNNHAFAKALKDALNNKDDLKAFQSYAKDNYKNLTVEAPVASKLPTKGDGK